MAGSSSNGNVENGIGSSSHNGIKPWIPASNIKEEELVRVIVQSLNNLGYTKSAQQLQEESKICIETKPISDLRNAVLQGMWNQVDFILPNITLRDDKSLKFIKFLIMKQRFLELLEEKKTKEALVILRNYLSNLTSDSVQLHKLTSLIMCSSLEEIREKINWDGKAGTSRTILLGEIQQHISPSQMIPDNRLVSLLQQALAYQRMNSLYYEPEHDNYSLLEDFKTISQLTVHEAMSPLRGHKDEIWFADFSNDGKKVASASKDKTAIVWSLDTGTVKCVLIGHEDAISFLKWSPDDSMILTCGRDRSLKLWDAETGALKKTFLKHTEEVTTCEWFADGRKFLSAGLDKNVCIWDIHGNLKNMWQSHRIYDVYIKKDGQKIFLAGGDEIKVFNTDGIEENCFRLPSYVTSLKVSADEKYMILSLLNNEIHLWDHKEGKLIRKFTGHEQEKMIIRSSFGGPGQMLIVSGSEDEKIYLWHRDSGSLIASVPGHSGIVNSVCWSLVDPSLFVSASDDKTLRVWKVVKN